MTHLKSMPFGIMTIVLAIYFNVGAIVFNIFFSQLWWLSAINIVAVIALTYALNTNFYLHYKIGDTACR